jgi:hypothetical protein
MKKALLRRSLALCCVGAFLGSGVALAQRAPNGDWAVPGNNVEQDGWQKAEVKLSPETAKEIKFLWKLKLGQPSKEADSYTEPILIQKLVTALGFKDFLYWSSPTTLYAVDSELGELVWTKKFDEKSSSAAAGCSASALSVLMEPPVAINFNARRAPGAARPVPPPPPPPVPASERRVGLVPPAGASRPVRGVYVLTNDGMLHEQSITNGVDFAPPVKFLPAANAGSYGMNYHGAVMYTSTANNCGSVPNGVWALDMSTPSYALAKYETGKVKPLSLTGPVLAPDGTAYVVTGNGTSSGSVHADSVVALGKNMSVKDWYTSGGTSNIAHVSPVLFTYKEKLLAVAPGKDGSIVLLDAAAIGGADHHTALSTTSSFFKATDKHPWDGFASWTDKQGTTWVFASISGPITTKESAAKTNGATTHGGIVAFRVEDADGKPVLTPAWISPDMVNPAPPRIANGLIVGLAGGNATTHAKLYFLDATTGAPLYSSKDEIPTYTHFSGVSIGEGHAYFTDRDNTLYSFGIELIH